MACKDLDFLWKEYFRDPSQFWDNQTNKRGSRSPDLGHKVPLSMDVVENPPCVKEELARSKVQYGEICKQKARGKDKVLKGHQEFQDRDALFNLIKACGRQKDLHKGSRLHAAVVERGLLRNDITLSNAILSMYTRCGALAKAQEMFDQLPARNVVTWNVLIAGYAQHGLGDAALSCFRHMQDEGLSPDAVTFIGILKACGSLGAAEKGEEIHTEIDRQGLLEKDIVLGTALVNMYAKCGALSKAQGVFDKLKGRDTVTWNALIAGYAQHGLGDKALISFEQMQEEGFIPDAVTFACILKACGNTGAAERGEEIHAEASRQGLLEKDNVLGTALVDMYAKCGALGKAQAVFNKLPARNVVTWNALMAGYAQYGHGDEVLSCFERMREEGFFPDLVTFVCLLKACGSTGAFEKGEEIHAEIGRQGLSDKDNVLGTALVDMYAKCGALAKAQRVFDKLLARDVATWTVLIAGYAQHGLVDDALGCFEQMQGEGLCPDIISFVCILRACGSIGSAMKVEEIHAEISRQGLLEKDNALGTTLVDMYATCGALAKAQGVFDNLPKRNIATWNALIAGYAQHGLNDEVLSCFGQMQDEGLSPDAVTFVCILKACGSIGLWEKGEEIHAEVDRQGLLKNDIVLGNALVDMYAKCGALVKAQEVFDKLTARGVITWNALIAGYAQHGLGDEALRSFEHMEDEGLSPDVITFVCVLKACGTIRAAEKGEEIHAKVERRGLLEKDNILGFALVDMYAKCGALAKAQGVFDRLPAWDVASWTALIAGYSEHGLGDEALRCFGQMRDEGFSPDTVTFVCILKACGSIGAVEKGNEIRAEVSGQGLLEKDKSLGTALVDMYAKCGILAKAQAVFDMLPSWNVVTWNSLIAGYAQVGKAKTVFDSFIKMVGEGIEPDMVTFVVLLTACSHAGLVEEGQVCFVKMSTVYHINPTLEHYTCMVDNFSRAGHFEKAISMIEKVSPSDCLLLWSALMGACRKWENLELGIRAFQNAVHLDEKFGAAYVCMSNIYAAAGTQYDTVMKEKYSLTGYHNGAIE